MKHRTGYYVVFGDHQRWFRTLKRAESRRFEAMCYGHQAKIIDCATGERVDKGKRTDLVPAPVEP